MLLWPPGAGTLSISISPGVSREVTRPTTPARWWCIWSLRCVRGDHDSNPNRRKPSSNRIRLETAIFSVCFVVKPKSSETVEGPKSSETVVEPKSSETVVEPFGWKPQAVCFDSGSGPNRRKPCGAPQSSETVRGGLKGLGQRMGCPGTRGGGTESMSTLPVVSREVSRPTT